MFVDFQSHSFCVIRVSVLQFCDFFNALLSIWVTLVAMASLGQRATSFCQMLGVVVLAVGAELDRTALWVFLLPTVCGCLLVISSWAYKCRQKGETFHPNPCIILTRILIIFLSLQVRSCIQQSRTGLFICPLV